MLKKLHRLHIASGAASFVETFPRLTRAAMGTRSIEVRRTSSDCCTRLGFRYHPKELQYSPAQRCRADKLLHLSHRVVANRPRSNALELQTRETRARRELHVNFYASPRDSVSRKYQIKSVVRTAVHSVKRNAVCSHAQQLCISDGTVYDRREEVLNLNAGLLKSSVMPRKFCRKRKTKRRSEQRNQVLERIPKTLRDDHR